MHRIEFAGVSGSGKTALCARLFGRRRIPKEWSTLPAALARAERMALVSHLRSTRGLLTARGAGSLLRLIPRTVRRTILLQPRRAVLEQSLEAFVDRHQEFFDIAARAFAVPGRHEYVRLRGYQVFVGTAERIALIDRWHANAPVVVEEGFVHRFQSIVPWSTAADAISIEYAEAMPAPAAIVHVDVPADVALDRAMARFERNGRLTPAYRGPSRTETIARISAIARQLRRIVDTLEERGVVVARIDGTTPLSDSVARVEQFMSVNFAKAQQASLDGTKRS
jgi:hypothetical protein